MNKISKYIEILELCKSEQSFEGDVNEFADHIKLVESGYIGSIYGAKKNIHLDMGNGVRLFNMIITPKGVSALIKFKRLRYDTSFRGQFFKFVQAPLWIVFGFSLDKLKDLLLDITKLFF
jgi:hypothetical protein